MRRECCTLENNAKVAIAAIDESLAKLASSPTLEGGIDVANAVVALMSDEPRRSAENVIDDNLVDLPNEERQDHWFVKHPWMGDERSAFVLFEGGDPPIQTNFYWMNKRTRQYVSGSVHLTENWEDHDFTRTDSYKVGIDFFLDASCESLLVVLSNRGNLRLLEIKNRLTNTQVEIFSTWVSARDIRDRRQLHSLLWDSFRLQSVNDSFYLGVSNSFNEILQHLVQMGREEEKAKLFSSRLLGRVIFTWFLRNMQLVNEEIGYFEVDGVDASDYYKESLQTLFFGVFNKPIESREADHSASKFSSPLRVDLKTPYLNGGLFEPSEGDWFNDPSLTMPTGFFERLFGHFGKYNFTTDESTPEYEQVAIDPEMLGRVFESLLATQIDDTGTQARKAKGAFYTPREIVAHMCKESLRSAFKARAGEDAVLNRAIDSLLDVSDRDWAANGTNSIKWALPVERRKDFLEILNRLSAVDPACGSGAFPMGLVNLLMRVHERVNPGLNKHEAKLRILENNIFGCDIEPMAVEISRLRAWLSIVVERDRDQALEPLPNLDFNFVCANSLIPLEESSADLFNDPDLNTKLAKIRRKYFNATSPEKKEKLRTDYEKIARSEISLLEDRRTQQLRSFEPFRNLQPADFFEPFHMFGRETFDVVIGNPPYGAKLTSEQKSLFKKKYQIAKTANGLKGSTDSYAAFIELGLNLLEDGGNLNYILPISVMSSDSMTQGHELLKTSCRALSFAAFAVRPKPIFENATVNVAILLAEKGGGPAKSVLSTKLYRKNAQITVSDIVNNLQFQDVLGLEMPGRFPKISDEIEVRILGKLQALPTTVSDLRTPDGAPIFYRAAGGRYFKVITDKSTNSSAEKSLLIDTKYASFVGLLLSSSLFFWFYQLFSDNLNLKASEIESFPIPIENALPDQLERAAALFSTYQEDIFTKSAIRKTEKYAHIEEFREFKLGRSIDLIDQIDEEFGSLFGLNSEEIEFIKNYERSFRVDDDDS